jgi:parvulin-like peptidyl-prolyl isomerase
MRMRNLTIAHGKKITVVLAALAVFAAAQCALAKQTDKIIAVVNDEVITKADLETALAPVYNQYRSVYEGEEFMKKLDEARSGILKNMIEDKLLLSVAKRREIEISEDDIEEKLNQVRSKFGSAEEFNETLVKQNLSIAELKDMYKDRLLVMKLLEEEIGAKIGITPVEVAEYYYSHKDEFKEPQKARVFDILIKPKDKETFEMAKGRAEEILRRLEEGMDFALAAREYSQGSNAGKGGDLGVVERGQMIPRLDGAIFGLEPGQISKIVESKIGFHIFKVISKTPERLKSLEEASDEIRGLVHRRKFDDRYKDYIEDLKDNAYISIK